MEVVDKTLSRLKANGFSTDPLKCEWAVQETDWLGYWLSPVSIKPWSKKVEAIVNMQRPETTTDFHTFHRMVTNYCKM